jgi:hypothetical protein
MPTARATASGGFWNGDDFVAYEEGDIVKGSLAALVIASPTIPFVDADAPADVVEITDGDTAASQEAGA